MSGIQMREEDAAHTPSGTLLPTLPPTGGSVTDISFSTGAQPITFVPLLCVSLRPPLSKKLFPVSRVGKKKASREVGNLFYFLISIYIN